MGQHPCKGCGEYGEACHRTRAATASQPKSPILINTTAWSVQGICALAFFVYQASMCSAFLKRYKSINVDNENCPVPGAIGSRSQANPSKRLKNNLSAGSSCACRR